MKYVVTIATGTEYYVNLAENLALSFLFWNEDSDIQFVILTDQPGRVNNKLLDRIRVVDISKDQEKGFLSKFSLANHIDEGKVLFLDSDCLIYGDVNEFFSKYGNEPFLAFGQNHTSGDGIGYCKNVPALLGSMDIPFFPIVTGSLYYFSDFNVARGIINYARDMAQSYDMLGFIRLRGKANEEPLIGVGMAKHGIEAKPDDGLTKGDIMFFEKIRSDVIKGKARLWNVAGPKVPFVTSLMEARPLFVHFDGINTQFFRYRSEVRMLRAWFFAGKSPRAAWTSVFYAYKLPHLIVEKVKNVLRPIYHRTFGPNKVKKSLR